MNTEQKAAAQPDGPATPKRDRRTQEEVKQDHYTEVLLSLNLEQKVELIKSLKESVNIEVANRSRLAEQALAITNGI